MGFFFLILVCDNRRDLDLMSYTSIVALFRGGAIFEILLLFEIIWCFRGFFAPCDTKSKNSLKTRKQL